MTSGQILDLRGIKWNLYFWKAHDMSYPKIQFLSILDKYFKSYGNINAIWPLFGMGSSQIWPCHVTHAKNVSFPYLKSYCPLNFRKSHQISWFCCIPNGSYKEDNLKEGRICPPCGIGLSIGPQFSCMLKPTFLISWKWLQIKKWPFLHF